MENSKLKTYIGAIIGGGIIGGVAQAIFMIYAGIGVPYPVNCMVFTIGMLGSIASFFEIFVKIGGKFGMGTDNTMFGLAGAITMFVINARREGKSNGEAAKIGLMTAAVPIFSFGLIVCIVLALVTFLVAGGGAS